MLLCGRKGSPFLSFIGAFPITIPKCTMIPTSVYSVDVSEMLFYYVSSVRFVCAPQKIAWGNGFGSGGGFGFIVVIAGMRRMFCDKVTPTTPFGVGIGGIGGGGFGKTMMIDKLVP